MDLILTSIGTVKPFSDAEIAALEQFLPHPPEYYRKITPEPQEHDEQQWRVLRAFQYIKAHGKAEEAVVMMESMMRALDGDTTQTQSAAASPSTQLGTPGLGSTEEPA